MLIDLRLILCLTPHRDYSTPSGCVAVAVFDDRIEVRSIGALPRGVTADDRSGPHESIPRNPLIAEAFHRTGAVEIWGRGTNRVIDACERHGIERPIFEEQDGAVYVTFKAQIGPTPQVTPQVAVVLRSAATAPALVPPIGFEVESVELATGRTAIVLSVASISDSVLFTYDGPCLRSRRQHDSEDDEGVLTDKGRALARRSKVPVNTGGSDVLSWRSRTPFVLVRHWQRGKNTPTDQVMRELTVRGFPVPEEVTRRGRSHPPGAFGFELVFREPVRGPILLGYGCHYGLGQFEAMA